MTDCLWIIQVSEIDGVEFEDCYKDRVVDEIDGNPDKYNGSL